MKTCPQCDSGYPDSHTTCPIHGHLLNEIRDLKPGMIIRQSYRITRKLGQGGMGAVYLAQHTLMNEPQALKFLSSELSHDEAFTARFLREVRTLRQIRHKNVVDAGNLEPAEDGTLFFSMEFVDGPDLRTFLRDPQWRSVEDKTALIGHDFTASGKMPTESQEASGHDFTASGKMPTESQEASGHDFSRAEMPLKNDGASAPAGSLPVPLALSIARQIAEGLGAAHLKGMVHRDIKPENILMARDGGAWLPKIADFGIVATKESSTAYTRTGGTLLTMAYAAPEQWRGTPAAELDGRTDFYALGGLLYEMLTGQTPFRAENYEGWARQHQTTPPLPPSALRPDLANWQGLDALTLRLLAKDREDRPKDVAELVGLLDAVVYVSPPIVHSITEMEPLQIDHNEGGKKSTRGLPALAWVTAVVLLVIAAFSAGHLFGPQSFKPLLNTFPVSTNTDQLQPSKPMPEQNMSTKLTVQKSNTSQELKPVPAKESKPPISGQNAEKIFDQAFLQFTKGNYAKAATLYERGCTEGSQRACEYLLDAYRELSDCPRGVAFFTATCDGGGAYACEELGTLYGMGQVICFKQDDSRSKMYYLKAVDIFHKKCDVGSGFDCYQVAWHYHFGIGVPLDKTKEFEFYSRACEAGNIGGCIGVGRFYQDGTVVNQDQEKAKQFYLKACTLGAKWMCADAKKMQ